MFLSNALSSWISPQGQPRPHPLLLHDIDNLMMCSQSWMGFCVFGRDCFSLSAFEREAQDQGITITIMAPASKSAISFLIWVVTVSTACAFVQTSVRNVQFSVRIGCPVHRASPQGSRGCRVRRKESSCGCPLNQ